MSDRNENIQMLKNTTAYIHVRCLIDGTGTSAQKNVVLTVENNKITQIQSFSAEIQPKITKHLSNQTICPMLSDAHVHLAMSGTLDGHERKKQLNMDFEQAKKVIFKNLAAYAKAGVSILRDAGDRYGHTWQFKQTEKLDIQILSPGKAWYREGRYGQFFGSGIHSTDNCVQKIQMQNNVDHIKIVQSGINSIHEFGKQTRPQFSQDEMNAICRWAKKNNLPVMVHANGSQPVEIAINAGCNSIEHGYFMGTENLKRMADQQIYWIPTLVPMHVLFSHLSIPGEKDIAWRTFDSQCEQVRIAQELDVPIVVGSDAGSFGVYHGKGLFDEMRLLIDCGLTPAQVIAGCSGLSRQLFNCTDCGLLIRGEIFSYQIIPKSLLIPS